MKLKHLLIVFFSFLIIAFNGCYYDNLEELHPGSAPCDTTGTISFAGDIMPIFTRSCGNQDAACHTDQSSSSTYGLANYPDVIFTSDDSPIFLEVIKHIPPAPSNKWMPESGGKLDDCSIQKIEAWLNRGRPDN